MRSFFVTLRDNTMLYRDNINGHLCHATSYADGDEKEITVDEALELVVFTGVQLNPHGSVNLPPASVAQR